MSNNHTVLKPIGSKKLTDFTEVELQEIKNVFCSSVNLEKYFDCKSAYIIDYYSLSRVDNLFLYKFKDGKDLSFILSIADWADHTFKGIGHLIEKLFKDISHYSAKEEKEFYNQTNAELIWENFNQYINNFKASEESWADQKKHEYLAQFCKTTLHCYGYHFSMTKDKKKEDRSFNLYLKNIKALKGYYIKKPDDENYFARICIDILHELMVYSRGKISLDDRVVKDLLFYIKPEINQLWNSIDFIIKDNLFQKIKIESESFKISEYLISFIDKDDFKKILLNDFLCNSIETKHIDKQLYFLEPLWKELSNEQFRCVLTGVFKALSPDKMISFIQTVKVPEKFLEIIKFSELDGSYVNSIKKEDYDKVLKILTARSFEKKLLLDLVEKENQSIKVAKL